MNKRRSAFGEVAQRKPYVSLERQVAEATARGQKIIQDNRRALAGDSASSQNQAAACKLAQSKNQEALEMLKAGKCVAFNPIAQKT